MIPGAYAPGYFLTPPRGLIWNYIPHRGFAPTTEFLRPAEARLPPLSFCKEVGILLEVEEAAAALARGLHQVAIGTELLDHVVGRIV